MVFIIFFQSNYDFFSTSTITYGKNTYYIDTRGKSMGTGCTHAVVCLHTEKSGPGKIIGHFNKRKFYIEGMLFSFSTVFSQYWLLFLLLLAVLQ